MTAEHPEDADRTSQTSETPAPARKRLSILKWLLLGFAVLVAVFLIAVALQPSDFRVSRSAVISAPPSVVFGHVNEFRRWQTWSPWAKLDPQATETYEGPAAGEGAVLHWDGNSQVGAGSMTILESRPNEFIQIKLAFLRPMEDTCTVEFDFAPEGEQTKVTWSMYGENSFLGRVMCLFMNMDEMVGKDFETGLAQMKAVVEGSR